MMIALHGHAIRFRPWLGTRARERPAPARGLSLSAREHALLRETAATHATHVKALSDPRDYDPPRIWLPDDRDAWPPPTGRPYAVWPDDGWFAGVLDGGIPQLPDGWERTGGGWSAYG